MQNILNKFSRTILLTSILITLFSSDLTAQEKPKSRKQQQKELRKKKEKHIKDQRDAEKKLHKHHFDIQDKATKRRMKKTKKQSDRLNKSKRR